MVPPVPDHGRWRWIPSPERGNPPMSKTTTRTPPQPAAIAKARKIVLKDQTWADLLKATGVYPTQMRKIERGITTPQPATLKKLSKFLCIPYGTAVRKSK